MSKILAHGTHCCGLSECPVDISSPDITYFEILKIITSQRKGACHLVQTLNYPNSKFKRMLNLKERFEKDGIKVLLLSDTYRTAQGYHRSMFVDVHPKLNDELFTAIKKHALIEHPDIERVGKFVTTELVYNSWFPEQKFVLNMTYKIFDNNKDKLSSDSKVLFVLLPYKYIIKSYEGFDNELSVKDTLRRRFVDTALNVHAHEFIPQDIRGSVTSGNTGYHCFDINYDETIASVLQGLKPTYHDEA